MVAPECASAKVPIAEELRTAIALSGRPLKIGDFPSARQLAPALPSGGHHFRSNGALIDND